MSLNPGTTRGPGQESRARPGQAPGGTRHQLLAAASEVFAAVGFRDATVRDICRKAGANVAAVNYHFGGKEGLYSEVLQQNYRRALDRFPPGEGLARDASPKARLRAFVRSFLLRIFSEGPDSCHGRLLAREMVDPTPALDALVATEVRALANRLAGILGDLIGPGADATALRLSMGSVVSQIVFYHHCRAVISRLFPDLGFGPAEVEALADHITRFSLAGIRAAVDVRTRTRRVKSSK